MPLRPNRVELLLAARAAERWPVGRHRFAWFTNDKAEERYGEPHPVPVLAARRFGGPAVAVAAFRVMHAGREDAGITWREVWTAQSMLVDIARAMGVREFLETLSEDPLRLAAIWRDFADEEE